MQGTWSRPQSNNLLFDAGITVSKFNFGGFGKDLFLSDYEGCGGGIQDNVSINDTGLGFTYNGVGFRQMALSHQSNGRFNVSLITRPTQHQDRRVLDVRSGRRPPHLHDARADAGQRPAGVVHVRQRHPRGRSRSLRRPIYTVDQLNPDLGLFVQDQWRLSRFTISAGLRFDWLRESVKATSVAGRSAGAGAFVPGAHRRAQLEGPQSAVRHRLGSDRRREDRDQVRDQPLRAVGHDGPWRSSSTRRPARSTARRGRGTTSSSRSAIRGVTISCRTAI